MYSIFDIYLGTKHLIYLHTHIVKEKLNESDQISFILFWNEEDMLLNQVLFNSAGVLLTGRLNIYNSVERM